MKETEIQKQIMEYLRLNNIMCWRNNTGSKGYYKFGFPGSPDIIGILKGGCFLGVEVKTEKGKLSTMQKVWQAMAKEQGACIFTTDSLEKCKEELFKFQNPGKEYSGGQND